MRSLFTKTLRRAAMAGALVVASTTGCRDFLDVNTNPNGPERVSPNLYLAPMEHWMVTGQQFDGRFIGRYTQQWYLPATTLGTWDRMGYDAGSDNGGETWRNVYWHYGQNLEDLLEMAHTEQRWDLAGVGLLIKAYGWHTATVLYGEIIVKEAIDASKFSFNYDSQELAYQETQRLIDSALVLLARTDGAVDQAYLARTDKVYGGDRAKWTKFGWGLKAMNLNHFSNKASYKPAEVIAAVDKAFASNADDFILQYLATNNEDTHFNGWTRNNLRSYRQTQFVVNLMNGTSLGAPDPRMPKMLAPSPDGQFRGLDINVVNFGALTTAQQPNNFFGFPGTGGNAAAGVYMFHDRAKVPAMTYSQLQFIKAEAAYKLGALSTALDAYRNGISSHIDFVNARNSENGIAIGSISPTEKAAFLANPAIVPTNPANLTLTMIMSQKYIAQWSWGHGELWMDMRRYNYTGTDPKTGLQIYPGFAPPTNLFADNAGKIAQRLRPRYNSEYIWNRPGLDAIGGLATDYHTKPLWITQP